MATCAHCSAALEPPARFCPSCGAPAPGGDGDATEVRPPVGDQTRVIDVDLVSCPQCGSTNAAKRMHCGRCGTALRTSTGSSDAPPSATSTSTEAPPPVRPAPRDASPARRPRRRRLGAVVVALGLLVGAVAGLAVGLGLGPFAQPDPVAFDSDAYDDAGVLRPARAGVSSSQAGEDPHGAPATADDDPGTAWIPDGQDADPVLEHEFAAPVWVARVEVATGWQADESTFRANGRVTSARIDLGTVIVAASIEDESGTQVIRLPDPVLVDRVRWEVDGATGGPGAISEVRYIGWTATDEDAAEFSSR